MAAAAEASAAPATATRQRRRWRRERESSRRYENCFNDWTKHLRTPGWESQLDQQNASTPNWFQILWYYQSKLIWSGDALLSRAQVIVIDARQLLALTGHLSDHVRR